MKQHEKLKKTIIQLKCIQTKGMRLSGKCTDICDNMCGEEKKKNVHLVKVQISESTVKYLLLPTSATDILISSSVFQLVMFQVFSQYFFISSRFKQTFLYCLESDSENT